MKTRSVFASALLLLALSLSIVLFGATPGVQATQGQPVIAGAENSETFGTTFCRLTGGSCGFTPSAVYAQTDVASGYGLDGFANAGTGVRGQGTLAGVWGVGIGGGANSGVVGDGLTYGVHGTGGDGGTGVFGDHNGTTGIGVWGKTAGTGSAVYGQATGGGVGVFGDTTDGTGVIARSTHANALDVRGKAVFSRSGIATVPSGSKQVLVNMSGATTGSMILATVQESGGFYVKYVVPASGSFTIFINKAPASPKTVKVAYFVLN